MRTTDQAKFDGKKREILAAAARCFLREGLKGASVAKICSEIGISPGHLYHYFDSKEKILEGMAQIYLDSVEYNLHTDPAHSDMHGFLQAELQRDRTIGEPGDGIIFLDLIAEATRTPRVAELLQDNTRSVCALIEALIRREQERGMVAAELDPQVSALLLVSTLNVLKIAPVLAPTVDTEQIRQALAAMLRSYLNLQPELKPGQTERAEPAARSAAS